MSRNGARRLTAQASSRRVVRTPCILRANACQAVVLKARYGGIRRRIDLRYGFELAIEGPEIKSDFTPLALLKRACRRGARNHEIGTETIELAITTTGISFIASACSGVAKTRRAPTPKMTACTTM